MKSFLKYMGNTCFAKKTTHVFPMYTLKNKVLNLKYMGNTWEIHGEYMFSKNTWEIHVLYMSKYMGNTWGIHGEYMAILLVR